MDCIFCQIAEKKIPATFLYEDDICMAFHDIQAQAPVHFLVVPKGHCATLAEANPQVVSHIMEKIPEIAKSIGVSQYRLVNNNGEEAGQTVPHLHFHVLSGRELAWPPG